MPDLGTRVGSDLLRDLESVARFGGEGTAVTRFAWSRELFGAYAYVGERMRELGLEVEIDEAGNLIGRWNVGTGKAVVVGSHLDGVPRGGRFDGTLGVLAGLHAVRLLQAAGVRPARPVWVVAFMDEDGGRFGAGSFGSSAFVGRDLTEFSALRDADGVSVGDAMAQHGFAFERVAAAKRIGEVWAYLELHIEAGPVLERDQIDLGIVTAIAGGIGFRLRLRGEANHAGTTPMRGRRDALAGAARIILALREHAHASGDATATVGTIHVEPGGLNVIPGEAELTIDVRSAAVYDSLGEVVRDVVTTIARDEGLEAELELLYGIPPCVMDDALVAELERAADAEEATHTRMISGAGHDAMELGRFVPAGMLFVPSKDGISHNPAEFTAPDHCELGARTLARALASLVDGRSDGGADAAG